MTRLSAVDGAPEPVEIRSEGALNEPQTLNQVHQLERKATNAEVLSLLIKQS